MLRLLYTGNPFYAVSAVLVLVGLRGVVAGEAAASAPWILPVALTLYTGVLSVASWVIVRLGGVWDDARSLLLTIAILLLAISTSLDEAVLREPWLGAGLVLALVTFAFTTVEGLLRGLRIRLAPGFRWPLHTVMGVIVAYPLVPAFFLHRGATEARDAAVAAFPLVVGACLLALLPAARRGRSLVRESGTPWSWPTFPWSIFLLLAFGACARAYLLGISFGVTSHGSAPTSPWLALPIAFAASALLLEIGITERHRAARFLGLVAPLALSLVALVFADTIATTAVGAPSTSLSPALVALAASSLYLALACWRRVPGAELLMILCIASLLFVGPSTLGLATLTPPRLEVLWALTAILFVTAALRRESWRIFAAASCAIFTTSAFLEWGSTATETGGRVPWVVLVPYQGVAVAALVVGLATRDSFSSWLRRGGTSALTLFVLLLLVLHGDAAIDVTGSACALWIAAIIALQGACAAARRCRYDLVVALSSISVVTPTLLVAASDALGIVAWSAGIWILGAGLASLLVGLSISFAKAGWVGTSRAGPLLSLDETEADEEVFRKLEESAAQPPRLFAWRPPSPRLLFESGILASSLIAGLIARG